MSKNHFFKHLSFALSRTFVRPPLSLSPLLIGKPKCRYGWNRSSSLLSKMPVSSYVRFCASLTSANDTPTTTESSAYLSVRIRCPKDVANMLSETLLSFGACSTSMDEEDDSENSNEIYIDSIFPSSEDVHVCLSQAADSIGLKEMPPYEVKLVEQYDWIQKTQESFHPVEVTEGLWIVPEWISPPDDQATNIILNPGLAFGTGDHATTKLCLMLLQHSIKGGELFLDYGTGSGILAIAALKFGATQSVGFDIDPQAIASARHNASLNNIGPNSMILHLVPSEIANKQNSHGTEVFCEREKYDVVIANILLNPLLELADDIVSYAKHGALIGLSGILSQQLPYILDRYSVFLEEISVSVMDDWACISGRKKSNLNKI